MKKAVKKKPTTRRASAMFGSKAKKELENRVIELEEQNKELSEKYKDLEKTVEKIIELHEDEWVDT